jgi:hypothetical protein
MHNFRKALRVVGSNKRQLEKKIKRRRFVGKSNRRKHRRGFRRELSRRRRRDSSVNKPIKVRANNYDVGTYDGVCVQLRKLPFQRNGRYWRYQTSMKLLKLRGMRPAVMGPINHNRNWLRRRNWFFLNSYKKLARSLVEYLGDKGFLKYCGLVKLVGARKAFDLYNTWRSKEARKVKTILEDRRRRAEAQNLNNSKPVRDNYRNFKTWKSAIEKWQTSVGVCKSCYKSCYAKSYDEDKEMWKGSQKYDIMYKMDIRTKILNKCSICSKGLDGEDL